MPYVQKFSVDYQTNVLILLEPGHPPVSDSEVFGSALVFFDLKPAVKHDGIKTEIINTPKVFNSIDMAFASCRFIFAMKCLADKCESKPETPEKNRRAGWTRLREFEHEP